MIHAIVRQLSKPTPEVAARQSSLSLAALARRQKPLPPTMRRLVDAYYSPEQEKEDRS